MSVVRRSVFVSVQGVLLRCGVSEIEVYKGKRVRVRGGVYGGPKLLLKV